MVSPSLLAYNTIIALYNISAANNTGLNGCNDAGVDKNVTSSPEMAKKFENIVSGKRLYALKKEEKDFKSAVTLVDTSADHDIVINKEFC